MLKKHKEGNRGHLQKMNAHVHALLKLSKQLKIVHNKIVLKFSLVLYSYYEIYIVFYITGLRNAPFQGRLFYILTQKV